MGTYLHEQNDDDRHRSRLPQEGLNRLRSVLDLLLPQPTHVVIVSLVPTDGEAVIVVVAVVAVRGVEHQPLVRLQGLFDVVVYAFPGRGEGGAVDYQRAVVVLLK